MAMKIASMKNGRERDAEADQRDVGGERQRLHLTGLEQVVLLDGTEGRRHELHWQIVGHADSPFPKLPATAPVA
jgi:hypothetical protein